MLYVNVDFSDRNEATKISSLVYPVLHILGVQQKKLQNHQTDKKSEKKTKEAFYNDKSFIQHSSSAGSQRSPRSF